MTYRKMSMVLQTNWSLTVSQTVFCKLGCKRRLQKKWTIYHFWKKKKVRALKLIPPSWVSEREEIPNFCYVKRPTEASLSHSIFINHFAICMVSFFRSTHVISLIDPALSVSSHTSNPQDLNMDAYQHDIQDMPTDFNDAMANHATSQSNVSHL